MTKTTELLSAIENKELVLPEFQREFTWNRNQSRELIDSLLKDYPTGSLLVWRTNEPPALKNMPDFFPNGRVNVLLDGQQRLTVLYLLIKDELPPYYSEQGFDMSKDPRNLYYNLSDRRLGYYRQIEMGNNPLWVRVADCFKPNRISLEKIAENVTQDSEEKYSFYIKIHQNLESLKNLRDVQHPIMYVKDDANLYHALQVFHRVNSGGTPLSEADIALAYMCSEWSETRRVFKKKLDDLKNEGFEFDLTFMVRAMNAIINGRAHYHALHTVKKHDLISAWKALNRLLDYLINFLRDRAYIYSTNDLNTYNVLIPVIGYLARSGLHFQSEANLKKILYWIYAALFQQRYSGSVDERLERDLNAINSEKGIDTLLAVLREDDGEPVITKGNLDSRGVGHPLYNMSCIVIRARGGVDWCNGLNLGQPYGESYKINRHHIFPKSLLVNEGGYDPSNNPIHQKRINEIANRVPLTQSGNVDIYNSHPEEYLLKVEEHYPGNLRKFLIPAEQELWKIENYESFLENRRKLIADAINEYMNKLLQATDEQFNYEYSTEENLIRELIRGGENEKVELKIALKFNPRTGEKDSNLEDGVLKNIAAFLNTDGGDLLIGVKDDGEVRGITTEGFPNYDKLMLHLINLIRSRIGTQFPRFLRLSISSIDDKKVLRVNCQHSPVPAFLKSQNEEKFYIRTGPSTTYLQPSEIYDYIQREFYT